MKLARISDFYQQLWMYYGSAYQELVDVAAYAPGRLCMWNYQPAEILCVKWRHGRQLERYIKNRTQSIDAYLLEEQSCQFFSRSDLKRRSLRLFLKRSPQQEELNSKMGSDNFGSLFSFWSKKYAECVKRLGLYICDRTVLQPVVGRFSNSLRADVHVQCIWPQWQIVAKIDAGFRGAKSAKNRTIGRDK